MPKHIQSTWTDLSNITRCQMTTKERYDSHFKENGFSLPYFILSLPYMNQPPYERVTGEVQFYPDPESPRRLPWLQGAAITFGRFYDAGKPWECCPRSFLIAQEQKLETLDVKIRIGFELEFYLLNLNGTPVNSTGYGEPKAFQGITWKVISSVIAAMTELEIPVWKYHAEAGSGQFEISIGPFQNSMLKAGDSLVLARQAISHIAASFELKATFLPKPIIHGPGSSIHTHVSLWNLKDDNLFEVAPDRGNSFLSGIFNQLPNMMPILCPTGNSYDRLGPFGFSGGFHCIGTENRKAAIRLFRDENVFKRFEVRTPDGTSSPYLVLGTLIGAGIHGMENGYKLPPLVEVDPLSLQEEARPPMLPTSLAAAIKEFAGSPFNRDLYGDELFNLILLIRKGEEAYWSSAENTMQSKMKLLLDKY